MYLKLEKNIIKGSKGNFKPMNKEGKDNYEGCKQMLETNNHVMKCPEGTV